MMVPMWRLGLLSTTVLAVLGAGAAMAAPRGKRASTEPAVAAPPPGYYTVPMAPAQPFTRLSEGLPNSNVTAVAQDSLGFMWFGTQDGLARYDGARFVVYRHDQGRPHDPPFALVSELLLDARGILWIGTGEDGLYSYDSAADRFRRFGERAGEGPLARAGITALRRGSGSSIWVGTADGRLAQLRDDRVARQFELDAGEIRDVAEAAGALWVACEEGLVELRLSDGRTTRHVHDEEDATSLSDDSVHAVLVDRAGALWVGTDGGLDRRAEKGFVHFRHAPGDRSTLSDDRVTSIVEEASGDLWVGTQSGLNRRKPGDPGFTRYERDLTDPRSIGHPWITTAFVDRSGMVWFGQFDFGLVKYDPIAARFGHTKPVADRLGVATFHEEPGGDLWVGCYPGGLLRYRHREGVIEVYERLTTDEHPEGIDLMPYWPSSIRRRGDELWVATLGQGIFILDVTTHRARQLTAEEGLPSDQVMWLTLDRGGSFWVGTLDRGLARLDPGTMNVEPFDGLSSESIYTIVEDVRRDGVFWVGTAKGGLDRIEPATSSVEVWTHAADKPSSISSNDVVSIHQSPDGIVWLGTYGGGLNRFDPARRSFERFGAAEGLPNQTVLGIAPDATGKLWVSTNGGGLVRMDPARRTMTRFATSDGIQSMEFAQNSAAAGSSGRLYFGGPNGFNAFDPAAIARDTFAPAVVLTGLKILNHPRQLDRPIWAVETVELSYTDAVFSFEFAALAYAGGNRYAHRLEGLHSEWIDSTSDSVSYSKLEPGDYRFELKAQNRHGVWSGKTVSLGIHVEPPPWRTWWAYALYALVAFGAIAAYVRYARQRVKALEKDHRIAAMVREVELTGVIQSGFLPKSNELVVPPVQLVGYYRPANVCSGDWWWYETSDEKHLILVVGDVTGHGPGPAMVTAAVAAAFRTQRDAGHRDLDARLRLLNSEVLRVADGALQMTISAVLVDLTSGEFDLLSAGGMPAIVVPVDGKVSTVVARSTPLGSAQFDLGRARGRLRRGDRLFLCTDGIPEVETRSGRQLGLRRLCELVASSRSMDLADAADHLVSEADRVSITAQADDWTFAFVQWS